MTHGSWFLTKELSNANSMSSHDLLLSRRHSGAFPSFMQPLPVSKRKSAFNILSVGRQAGTPTRKEDGEINSVEKFWKWTISLNIIPPKRKTIDPSQCVLFPLLGPSRKRGSLVKVWGVLLYGRCSTPTGMLHLVFSRGCLQHHCHVRALQKCN